MANAQPWFEENPQRLLRESDAMEISYPRFRLTNDAPGKLSWHGVLVSNSNNRYLIEIAYSNHHPYKAPLAYVREPKIRSLHQYNDGSLCLMHPGKTWIPKSTVAMMVPLVAGWIFCHENHQKKCRAGSEGKPCTNFSCSDWPGN